MAGRRIRTIKPELFEDGKAARLSCSAFRLFVGCISLADDHGNLRGDAEYLAGQIFWGRREVDVAAALDELVEVGMLEGYQVRGQGYLHIANWERHQKIDRPSPPRLPLPTDPEAGPLASPRESSRGTPDRSRGHQNMQRPLASPREERQTARESSRGFEPRARAPDLDLDQENPPHEHEDSTFSLFGTGRPAPDPAVFHGGSTDERKAPRPSSPPKTTKGDLASTGASLAKTSVSPPHKNGGGALGKPADPPVAAKPEPTGPTGGPVGSAPDSPGGAAGADRAKPPPTPFHEALRRFAAAAGPKWAPGVASARSETGLPGGLDTLLAGAWCEAQRLGYTLADFERLGEAMAKGAIWGRASINPRTLALKLEELLAEARAWDGRPPRRRGQRDKEDDLMEGSEELRHAFEGGIP